MLTQAVILAGGIGSRLKAITRDEIPKPMVPVRGEPFLYWQLQYLQRQGLKEIVLLLAHLGEVIEEHFRRKPIPGLNLRFIYEAEPLGTGGALKNAQDELQGEFFLINGDSFLPLNFVQLAKHCQARAYQACIVALTDARLVPVPGNLILKGDAVQAMQKGGGVDKGYSAVDAGVYWLKRSVVEKGDGGRFDLETYWPDLIQRHALGAFPCTQRFFDIGTPERLQFFEEHIDDYF